jgi:glycolate oxidase subunit GlcD
MRRVLRVDVENRLAVVEAGVVNAHVSRAVARHGLYYVPDPSSQGSCTVGGNIGENAGGIHCLKYGTTTDHVLGARVVLTDGRVVDLGGAGAEAPGYDLLGVFVGSEGTFGVVTEATVRLTPVAPSVRTLLADFLRLDDASRAVSAVIAEGIIPAGLEMVDGATIRAVEASVFAAGMPLDAEAALLVELDGLEAGMDEEVERVRAICASHGARSVRLAADEAERKRLWAARKGAFGAMGRITPDILIQDAVVPRSHLPEVLAATYRIGARHRLRVANVFHAGDGNLHPLVCFDSRDADQVRRVHEAGREIMETCVRAGGTITGEHGVGLDKSDYLPLVFGEDDMRAMLQVRAAFDPTGLCNPGKIIPAPKGCGEARVVAEAKGAAAGVKARKPEDEGRRVGTATLSSLSASATVSPAHVLTAALSSSDTPAASNGESHALPSVVEPGSAEEVCEFLRVAEREAWGVIPVGAGAQSDVDSGADGRHAVALKTTRLARLVEHEPADLVATAEAGMTLADFNREVGRAGQWLPLDPPGALRATLGGVVASGAAGAQGFGYGAPRSHVLGMKVALADGRVIRVGGRVVKNVAGYDLCKLFTSSRGTLGVILEITFRLRPRPRREATLVARSDSLGDLVGAARALVTSQLLPVAVELLSPRMAKAVGLENDGESFFALARFAGNEDAVEYQLARAAELVSDSAKTCAVERVEDDERLWARLSTVTGRVKRRFVWRAGVPPSTLGRMLELAGAGLWHAGAGDGRLRVFERTGDPREEATRANIDATAAAVGFFRKAARESGGSLVVEHAPSPLMRELDVWGLTDSSAFLMKRVKGQLDPSNTFSPGRFRFDSPRSKE